ncbi:hypothetical protein PL321_18925 [Caloramator sp. mosi_1]|uniref:hypothetical protein n=1 Tax=Caloramator sp. mosi_1 TaxID=3023090 RepID=UPI002360EF7C|nr:hypothetical protein [Caloramator sp. mosi_1]WDC84257.1 hypothetical protein PL321_18925 [Caloramator sp. mosi_1]
MYKIYWTDFHSNIHSKDLVNINEWYKFAKEMLDFWAPVYYPYFINKNENGFNYEDTLDSKVYKRDWELIREFCKNNSEEFILYMGYEWQGDGQDGDHNVFYRNLDEEIKMPLTYEELCRQLPLKNAVAIPHHPGYKSGHRGKNWDNNNELISPVVEIYSSHGCSESSDCNIPLNVHIHMGPRSEDGTVLYALKKELKWELLQAVTTMYAQQ